MLASTLILSSKIIFAVSKQYFLEIPNIFFPILPLPICLWSQRKGYQTTRMPSHYLDLPKQKQSRLLAASRPYSHLRKRKPKWYVYKAAMAHLQSCMWKTDPPGYRYPLLAAIKCKWNLPLHSQLGIFTIGHILPSMPDSICKCVFALPVTCLLSS